MMKSSSEPVISPTSASAKIILRDYRELIDFVLADAMITSKDTPLDYAVLTDLMAAAIRHVPFILSSRIEISGKTLTIKDSLKKFSMSEQEVISVNASIANTSICKGSILGSEIHDMFVNEKLQKFQQFTTYSFVNDVVRHFKTHCIGNPKISQKNPSSITEMGFVAKYLLESAHFRSSVRVLCEMLLTPSQQLIDMSLILMSETFKEGLRGGDFVRITTDKLSDILGDALSDDAKMLLASDLFNAHPYLYLSDVLGDGTFSDTVKSIGMSGDIKQCLKDSRESFLKTELKVIQYYIDRLSLGLVKWTSSDTSVDLKEKFTMRLQRDTFYKRLSVDEYHNNARNTLFHTVKPNVNETSIASTAMQKEVKAISVPRLNLEVLCNEHVQCETTRILQLQMGILQRMQVSHSSDEAEYMSQSSLSSPMSISALEEDNGNITCNTTIPMNIIKRAKSSSSSDEKYIGQ